MGNRDNTEKQEVASCYKNASMFWDPTKVLICLYSFDSVQKKIVYKTNIYAKYKFYDYTSGRIIVSGHPFTPVTLNEIFVFHGLLILFMLRSLIGYGYEAYWNKSMPYMYHSATKICDGRDFSRLVHVSVFTAHAVSKQMIPRSWISYP